mgnify:CR=1 FL=1
MRVTKNHLIMSIKKRATQQDVARLAGVSRSAVSFVLHGNGERPIPISEETRQRILAAARELNYTPDPVAQMLARGSNALIGVFTFEDTFPLEREDFYYEFILGIERSAERHDTNVILFTRRDAASARRKVFSGNGNNLRLADGTIFLGANPDRAELAQLAEEEYPFVYIGRREVPGHEINWVAADYTPASLEAGLHLIKLNHRQIAYVGSDTHIESNQDKISGLRQAFSKAGVEGNLSVLPESVLQDRAGLVHLLQENGCTAITCSHITTFDITLSLLRESGFNVPGDFSVLSLGDASSNPCFPVAPTYVSIDRLHWGELAVDLLVRRIKEDTSEPMQVRLPCHFIVGTSTAACPGL